MKCFCTSKYEVVASCLAQNSSATFGSHLDACVFSNSGWYVLALCTSCTSYNGSFLGNRGCTLSLKWSTIRFSGLHYCISVLLAFTTQKYGFIQLRKMINIPRFRNCLQKKVRVERTLNVRRVMVRPSRHNWCGRQRGFGKQVSSRSFLQVIGTATDFTAPSIYLFTDSQRWTRIYIQYYSYTFITDRTAPL